MSAPWFLSTLGYGFQLDSSAESTFDIGAGAAEQFVVTNAFSTLRINLVYGPSLTEVLARYTSYMGRPQPPPPWVFGPWISSDVWPTGGEVRYAVTQFRDRAIPASGFVFDSPWETAYNDFQFNMTQFGQDATIEGVHYPGFATVSEMMQFLRSNGLKVICWMTPLVNVSSDDEKIAGQNLGARQPSRFHQPRGAGMATGSAPGAGRAVRRDDRRGFDGAGGTPSFTVFDGSEAHAQGDASAGSVTVSSTPRQITLRILAHEPAAVLRDGTAVPRQQGPGAWDYDATAGFIELEFANSGGGSTVEYRQA